MGKEVISMGKSPELRISQSSGLTTESFVNNQPVAMPETGVIFDFTMNNGSDRTEAVDSSNYQPENPQTIDAFGKKPKRTKTEANRQRGDAIRAYNLSVLNQQLDRLFGESPEKKKKGIKRIYKREGSVSRVLKNLRRKGIRIGVAKFHQLKEDLDIELLKPHNGGKIKDYQTDLVNRATEQGLLDLLTEKQRMVLQLRLPDEKGKIVSLANVAAVMRAEGREAVRRLEQRGLRRLRKLLPDIIAVVKTQAMREIETEYGVPIDQVLRNLVEEGLNKTEIGRRLHKNRRTVNDWLENFGVGKLEVKKFKKTPLMIEIERRFKKPVEQILRKKYIDQKKSLPVVAKELRVDNNTVQRWLPQFGIPIRTSKEAMNLALSDPKKRKRITRKIKRTRIKLAESVARYHRERKALIELEKSRTS